MVKVQLSVIIVNYNVKYYLEQCLESVRRASEGLQVEVFVVDNLSTDGSIAYLRERFPHVTFIENTENVGFARANNQAIRISSGKYVLLLNPDTIVLEHTFSDFIRFMDEHSEAGGAGAYMLRTDGTFAPESRRGLPTPFVAFCKMSGLASVFPKSRLFGRYYMRYLDENEANEIEIISGAFMFLRREALNKNYYLPSRMLHYKGESTEKSSYRYVYTFYQAMQLFFDKHYAHYSFIVSMPISLAIWVRSFMAYVGNQFRHRKRPIAEMAPKNFLVVGSVQMLEEVRAILATAYPGGKHAFVEGSEATLPDGHLSGVDNLRSYDMVVYDMDAYSYSSALRLLEKTPGNTLRIATYSTKSKVLVTETALYTHNNA